MQIDPYRPPQIPLTDHSSPVNSGPRHSGPGIASVVLAAFGVLLICGGFIAVAASVSAERMPDMAPEQAISAMCVMAGFQLNICGFALAVAGSLISDRNRLYAFVGLAINGVVLAGLIFIFVLGMVGATAMEG